MLQAGHDFRCKMEAARVQLSSKITVEVAKVCDAVEKPCGNCQCVCIAVIENQGTSCESVRGRRNQGGSGQSV